MLCLLDVMEGLDPRKSHRKVVGVDIDIRPHNRQALDAHPLRFKMELIEGSSIDPEIVQQVRMHAKGMDRVLVSLDSNHTHQHVLAELNAYSDLVSVGSYCIVFDTVIEDLPPDSFPDRPWDLGNNPRTTFMNGSKDIQNFKSIKVLIISCLLVLHRMAICDEYIDAYNHLIYIKKFFLLYSDFIF